MTLNFQNRIVFPAPEASYTTQSAFGQVIYLPRNIMTKVDKHFSTKMKHLHPTSKQPGTKVKETEPVIKKDNAEDRSVASESVSTNAEDGDDQGKVSDSLQVEQNTDASASQEVQPVTMNDPETEVKDGSIDEEEKKDDVRTTQLEPSQKSEATDAEATSPKPESPRPNDK